MNTARQTVAEVKRLHSAYQPTGCWIRRERRLAIYLRDHFTCQYCERDLSAVPASEINLDHRKPVSKGGSNESENLKASPEPRPGACHHRRRRARPASRGGGMTPEES